MNDREKTLKGLEIHADRSDKTDCDDCSYSKDGFSKGDCIGQLCSDALVLLKEQKSIPVIQREVMHMLFWCCSSCGVTVTDGDKFCRNCGKGLIWND